MNARTRPSRAGRAVHAEGRPGGARRTRRPVVRATAAAVLVALVAACQPAPLLPVGGVATAVTSFVASPGAVAGANDWGCRPSPAHPRPVVLVHATGVNLGANWAALSPMLKNEGYCVFAFNYGFTSLSLGRIGGLGEISASARTMAAFVDRVLATTGAGKVDVVGHSQGGMMPSYYLKRLGGAAKVRTLVGLSPSNHGTSVGGIVTLGAALDLVGFANTLLWGTGIPAAAQQLEGSDFQRALFADGDTVAGVRYVVIQTMWDKVVTPYRNAFLDGPGVTNIRIQDQCPLDPVGHVGMFVDSPVLQNVLDQLGPRTPGFRARCTGFGPSL